MTTPTNPAAIQRTPFTNIKDFLLKQEAKIGALLPRHMTADRLLKVALNNIAKTPKLQECSASSLLQCIVTAAELGLEPGGALGHAYLVPFKGVCTLIIGYRGFVDLARRSGELADIEARVVRDGELLEVEHGLVPKMRHVPKWDDGRPMVAVYAIARLKDGSVHVEIMSKAQVDKIRARSRSGQDGPWATDYEEMAKKTVLRRLSKLLPMSSERLAKATEYDDEDYIDSTATEVLDEVGAEVVSATATKAKEAVRKASKAQPREQVVVGSAGPTVKQNEPPKSATGWQGIVDVPEGMSEEEAASQHSQEPPADVILPGQVTP